MNTRGACDSRHGWRCATVAVLAAVTRCAGCWRLIVVAGARFLLIVSGSWRSLVSPSVVAYYYWWWAVAATINNDGGPLTWCWHRLAMKWRWMDVFTPRMHGGGLWVGRVRSGR